MVLQLSTTSRLLKDVSGAAAESEYSLAFTNELKSF